MTLTRRSTPVRTLVVLVVTAVAALSAAPAHAQTAACYEWSNQVSLQTALNANVCVRIAPGTWQIPGQVRVPANHRVTGHGAESSTLQAKPPWNANGKEGVLNVLGQNDAVQIDALTLDANSVATYAVAARGMTVTGTVLKNAVCNGVGIAGRGVTIADSTITANGFSCPVAPPGTGIYVEGGGQVDVGLAPVLDGNTITGNGGPGLDVNIAHGGRFTDNVVRDNGSWAGVSLYGARGWTVSGNTIDQPRSNVVHPYHPACGQDLPNGPGSTALLLCQDTPSSDVRDTTVSGNTLSGTYGLALVGNGRVDPPLVPRSNTLTGNELAGSGTGCVDAHVPGQPDSNAWSANSCSGPGTGPVYAPARVAGRYHPLTPRRILDTRTTGSPVDARTDRPLRVLGAGGVPSRGVSAVVLGVTVPAALQGGDLQVYPLGAKPAVRTSNLNWSPRMTVANIVTVGVGADGSVGLSENGTSSHVVVDVLGWYGDASDPGGLRYTPLTPGRVLDTRESTPVRAGADRVLKLRGVARVPDSPDVTGVAVVLTALLAARPADVQVYPTGAAPAVRTSNTNLVRGQTVAVGVNATLGRDGDVSLSVSQGTVHLVVDVLGYYGARGSRYVPLVPRRILPRTELRGGDANDLRVQVAGRAGVPGEAEAVLVNVTGVGATANTDVQVYPAGDRPARRTSVLNLVPNRAVPDAVPARLGGGAIVLSASGSGRLQVILDQLGYFTRS